MLIEKVFTLNLNLKGKCLQQSNASDKIILMYMKHFIKLIFHLKTINIVTFTFVYSGNAGFGGVLVPGFLWLWAGSSFPSPPSAPRLLPQNCPMFHYNVPCQMTDFGEL